MSERACNHRKILIPIQKEAAQAIVNNLDIAYNFWILALRRSFYITPRISTSFDGSRAEAPESFTTLLTGFFTNLMPQAVINSHIL